jgi:hypothetical protein
MSPEYALILHCRTPELAERLVGVYANLLTSPQFTFRPQIHVNPPSDLVETLVATRRCLFFLEISSLNDTHSQKLLDVINNEYRPQGNHLILIADHSIDFLDLAIKHQVGNILFRDSIDTSTVGALTNRLFGTQFFGFEPFFPNHWGQFEQHCTISSLTNRTGLVDRLFAEFLSTLQGLNAHRFHGQMSELITNAIAYGVLGVTSEQRDTSYLHMPTVVDIPMSKAIKISVVQDEEKYGISVKDSGGSLTLLRILQKLRRHTPIPGQDLPLGIDDLTGRGLYIVSRQTRLVINVLRGVQTEVILLCYFDEERNRYKSLIINEKYPDPQNPTKL